jgi:peptidoglycan/xylan/chitin deacetylase (PgdA/CDA1 family)/glycosyltransferase involved in cell wall biosynthesis
VTVLAALLVVEGFAEHRIGHSGTREGDAAGAPLAGAGPLLTSRGGQLVARPAGDRRRIALTFDDGPDPEWTPRIAAELRRLHVPATFFVVGSQAARHRGIVASLHRDGFELGNHTFTHADVSRVPGWERAGQLDLTDAVVAGAAGIRTRLFRPPYSSTPAGVTDRQARVLAGVADRGYLIVLSDVDSRDWERPGTARIFHSIVAGARQGGIVLMHDGGGDRSQTLAALPRAVAALRTRGYRFTTVSGLARLPRSAVELPATAQQRARGQVLLATLASARTVTGVVAFLLGPIALLMLLRAALLVVFARRHARKARRRGPRKPFTPTASVIVPAYNESVGIERAVRSLVASRFPEFEVIVVDDGSADSTAAIVEGLGIPNVRVIRQPNAGKAAALNRGIEAAKGEVLVMVDADTVFEPDTLALVIGPLSDPAVGAVSGNTKVGNRRGLLGRWQHVEYVMGFNLDRRLYDLLRCMPTVPGAIGAFRRSAVADAGGVSTATLAEDTDLTIAIGRAGWRVVYEERARAWTEAPASLTALWRQRYRWSYGTMQAVWKHRGSVFARGEGPVGRRGIPYLVVFQVVLPALAPLIDLFALYGLLFLDPGPVAAYWIGFNLVQLAVGWYAFRLDGESPRVLWTMPLQQFVYRQLMYLVVIESIHSAVRGVRLRWQHLTRTGDVEVAGPGRPTG